ncbi:MAG: aldo/keto reductase [Candidatus Loosdrechtia sp.]|uniref:aldo/keto reductase n=1 Tax=Candidatus Loosdrechtia sp. TaxID=3101272 RepID=UPI003A754F03|nr:MAG: aldo/keto reductase [Candidatus Jettenia sp. AMX2]
MKYRKIPDTNLEISTIGLGTWVFGSTHWSGAEKKDCMNAARTALDSGINFIDTAPIYGDGLSEEIVGELLKTCRNKVIVATKCGLKKEGRKIVIDLSPESIRNEIEASLRRLHTDCIDLYQCHWPDPNTEIGKTMSVLLKAQSEGKIRYIGVSNFGLELLEQALSIAPVVSQQVQYSLLDRSIEKDLLPFCLRKQIGVLAYGPLGGGILSGKYQEQPFFDPGDARSFFYKFYQGKQFGKIRDGLEKLKEIKRPLNQIAINYVRQKAGVTSVLVGCRTVEQALSNSESADWDLSREQLESLENTFSREYLKTAE